MKAKNFKLKLFLIFALCFCIVGTLGSVFLVLNLISNSKEYVVKNTNVVTKEIYRSKEKIEVLDLSEISLQNIVLEKSTDGENSIEIEYNKNIKNIESVFDKKFPEKLNVVESIKEEKSFGVFNVFESFIEDVLKNRRVYFFDNTYFTKEKIVIKLTEPTELILNSKYNKYPLNLTNIDNDLLKKELNFKYYNYSILSSTAIEKGQITLKDYDDKTLELNNDFENITLKVLPKEMKNFEIKGYSTNINFVIDAKNISEKLEIDLDYIKGDFEILNANEVLINLEENTDRKYILNYKESDSNKEYVILPKDKEKSENKILIESKTVFYNDKRGKTKIK